jgi:hypothetical protein
MMLMLFSSMATLISKFAPNNPMIASSGLQTMMSLNHMETTVLDHGTKIFDGLVQEMEEYGYTENYRL